MIARSPRRRFAVRYARANVLCGHGRERAALYRLGTVSYPLLAAGGKWAVQRRLERFATRVGADFSLWRVNRAYPAGRYVAEMEGLVDERQQDAAAWRAYLEGQAARVGELGSWVPEVYLAVSMSQGQPAAAGRGLIRRTDRLGERVGGVTRRRRAWRLSHRELTGTATAEERFYARLRGLLDGRRASTAELEWLLRRGACRGVAEPRLDLQWQPNALVVRGEDGAAAYEPIESTVWRCAAAPLVEDDEGDGPGLVVDAEEGRSYQAMLTVGALAEEAVFPGAAAELLFAPLERLDFPVDAVLHARWVGNREALAQVRRRIVDAEHAYREAMAGSAHGPSWAVEDDRVLAREYEARLQSGGGEAMLFAWIGLAVGAPSCEERERRVLALRDAYGDVMLHRPAGLQEQLFFDHLPRPADGGATTDYVDQLSAEQFGALVPIASTEVGDQRGIYLGWSPGGGGRPVRYDATAPSRESRAVAVLLAGTLGSGKTVAAQVIAYGAERRGSLIVDFDRKPDHGWTHLRALDGRVEVIELSGDPEHRGALDPLRVAPAELREELTCSYLLELLRDAPAAWEIAIQRAVRDAVRGHARGTLAVIEELRSAGGDGAREAGEALDVLSDLGLARLGFGDGTLPAFESAGRPVVTIRTPGLTLPDPGASRETYTRSERISVATLTLVAALTMRLVAADRSRHKVVVLDEAWFLLASRQGRAVVEALVRMARGWNATILLGTQTLSGLGDLSDLVGAYLLFGQDSDAEAQRALDRIGLDPNDPALVALLRSFRTGRCLYRDLHGRVAEAQVDLVFDELRDGLETAPPQATGEASA
jgi:hypothetical protein